MNGDNVEQTKTDTACYINQSAADIFLDCFGGTLLLAEFPTINRLSNGYPEAMRAAFQSEAQQKAVQVAEALNREYPGAVTFTGWCEEYLLMGVDRETETPNDLAARFSEQLERISEVQFEDAGGTVEMQIPDSEVVCIAIKPAGMATADQLAEKLIRALDEKKLRRMSENSLWRQRYETNTNLWLPPSPYEQQDSVESGAIRNRLTQIMRRALHQKQITLSMSAITENGRHRPGAWHGSRPIDPEKITLNVSLEGLMMRLPDEMIGEQAGKPGRVWPAGDVRRMSRRLGLDSELDKAILSAAKEALRDVHQDPEQAKRIHKVILPISLYALRNRDIRGNVTMTLNGIRSEHDLQVAVCITGIPETPPETAKQQALLAEWMRGLQVLTPGIPFYAELDTPNLRLITRLPKLAGAMFKSQGYMNEAAFRKVVAEKLPIIVRSTNTEKIRELSMRFGASHLEVKGSLFRAGEPSGQQWATPNWLDTLIHRPQENKTTHPEAKPTSERTNIIDAAVRFAGQHTDR